MKNITPIAILFIAACAVSTGAMGQKVYRCGSTYSHIPCPEAVTIDAGDIRSKNQKLDADRATARATETANKLERDRLKTEEQAWASNKAQAEKLKKQTTKSEESVGTQKAASNKKKESELFTAASSSSTKGTLKTQTSVKK